MTYTRTKETPFSLRQSVRIRRAGGDAGRRLPECVGGEEGDVEGLLLRVVLQGDQDGVAEPHVGQQLKAHQAVARGAVVGVQHLPRVEELAQGRQGQTWGWLLDLNSSACTRSDHCQPWDVAAAWFRSEAKINDLALR